jgi:hypothetical protein
MGNTQWLVSTFLAGAGASSSTPLFLGASFFAASPPPAAFTASGSFDNRKQLDPR